jgi:cysteine desulfurase/selenocysteine lyase
MSKAETYTQPATGGFNVEAIRKDFPILHQKINGHPLAYFDNGATSQKPQIVIDSLVDYYTTYNSNVHRGLHYMSEKATSAYEEVREKTTKFINARTSREINFVRGTTEGINLIAFSYGRKFIGKDDEIIISTLEHHSNIVPWQMLCQATGAKLRVIPINEHGEIIMEEFEKLLSPATKLVSLVYISNSLGTINPAKEIIQKSHTAGAVVVLDAAQAAPHLKLDVQDLDCDFMCFSSHKMFGPTGIGIMYGKEALLEAMDPYQGGGEMIKSVSFVNTTYNDLPYKFEAGTPNIADGIAFGAAIDYINSIGLDKIGAYEHALLEYGTVKLFAIEGLKIIGQAKNKASLISFLVDGIHPYDMGILLDKLGIAIRTGHHCCQPLMDRFGITGTCRASFAFYNTFEEIDRLVAGIERAKKMLL